MNEDTRNPEDLAIQLAWEEDMMNRGITRYLESQRDARENGRGDEARAETRLLGHYVRAVASGIEEYCGPSKHYTQETSVKQLLRQMQPAQLAMITLRALLSELHNPKCPLPSVAKVIGNRVEIEILMTRLHAEYSTYFEEIMRKIERKESYDIDYKKHSILGSMRHNGVQYDTWTAKQQYSVGQQLIQVALEHCDLFYVHAVAGKAKGVGSFIRPTEECMEWIKKHDSEMSLMFPDRMPMKIQPDDWVDAEQGGYITPVMRKLTPLIIKSNVSAAASNNWLKMYNTSDMPKVYAGVNALQRTGWRVNEAVLRVLQNVLAQNLGTGIPNSMPYEFPPCPLGEGVKPATLHPGSDEAIAFALWKSEMRSIHELESERRAKIINVSRVARMAQEMSGGTFWFVYRQDFRGRVYCATSGLSPQGTELAKALLKFSDGLPLGKDGWEEFRISGANRYGNDKITFEDRVAWVESHSNDFRRVAVDPLGTRDIWGAADEPYQFLAWCIEYNNALNCVGGPERYKSYLPIGRDGSCNGLQHFSAMLRDSVGGAAVNLVPGALPADIYQTVADVLTARLRTMTDSEAAQNWLALFNSKGLKGCPRKLTKPPVMTLPYGSTERTCCDSIMEWYHENGNGFFPKATAFKHALFLSPLLWAAIGDVVIAARAAMKWLRSSAGTVARSGSPLLYRSMIGFPVKQQKEKTKSEKVVTYLNGRMQIFVEFPTGELDSMKMQNASSPNFVHQCDATHMLLTICEMLGENISSFAMIHDDYGCHACHVKTMQRIIREQFYLMYNGTDLLGTLRKQLEESAEVTLTDPPPMGDLDISGVLSSRYFFS